MRITAVLLLLSLALSACFDEIQLDLPPSDSSGLVIEGYVNQAQDHLAVFVLVGINAEVQERTVSVSPIEIQGAYLIYNGVAFPQYALANNQITQLPLALFEGQIPHPEESVFRLVVELPDGDRYESGEDRLFPVPEAQEINVETLIREVFSPSGSLIDRTFLNIKITTPLQVADEENAFLKWDMEGVYRFVEAPPPADNPFEAQNICFLPDRIGVNQIRLFNGRESTSKSLVNFPIQEVPVDHRFSMGYYLTIYQQALSPGAFRYWEQLKLNTAQTGGLFDATPGAVKGNIVNTDHPEEKVLGYFYTTQTDTIRRLIRGEEAGRPRILCFGQSYLESDFCTDCLLLRDATLQKPDYWVE